MLKSFKQFILESLNIQHGIPITFKYFRSKKKSPNLGTRFGQHIEPAGKYVNIIESNLDYYKSLPIKDYEIGEMTFSNPLVIDFGGGYTEESNWKYVLFKHKRQSQFYHTYFDLSRK